MTVDPPIRYVPVNAYNMRRLEAIAKTGATLPGCTSCRQALYDAFVAAGWIEPDPALGDTKVNGHTVYALTDHGRTVLDEWRAEHES